MAKTKKVITEIAETEQVNEDLTTENVEENFTEQVVHEPSIYIPDIPAQIIEKKESDEILFLRRLLQIQEQGGWGRHLHDIINDRIKELK